MAKDKAQVFKDTETTISVNWSGGGQVKDPAYVMDSLKSGHSHISSRPLSHPRMIRKKLMRSEGLTI